MQEPYGIITFTTLIEMIIYVYVLNTNGIA